MSFSISTKDNLTPQLAELNAALSPERLNPRIGAAATETFRRHFANLDSTRQNSLGGGRTHFWAQAARGTHFDVLQDGVKISVSQVGARQRVQGGEIRPVNAKWLTIPARAESYGKRAGEFSNLRFVIFRKDELAALISGSGGATVTRKTKGGEVSTPVKGATEGTVMYWLKKSVTQEADPTAIPSKEQILADINTTVSNYLARLSRRPNS